MLIGQPRPGARKWRMVVAWDPRSPKKSTVKATLTRLFKYRYIVLLLQKELQPISSLNNIPMLLIPITRGSEANPKHLQL